MKIFNHILVLILFSAGCLSAQQFVYRPVNPSFAGGDSFNGSYLLAKAQSQNNFSETRDNSMYSRNTLEDFSSSLNRSILSQLSKKIMEESFGESSMEEGKYEFGTLTVEIENRTDGMNVTIFDTSTGNETEIIIPYF